MQITFSITELIIATSIAWQILAAILIRFTPLKHAIFSIGKTSTGVESAQFLAFVVWSLSSIFFVIAVVIGTIIAIVMVGRFVTRCLLSVLELFGRILVGKENDKTSNSYAN